MLLVRPVRKNDHGELLKLATLAGIGMTSLPPDADVLEAKIARAVNSFAGAPEYPKGEQFLFVLEDVTAKKIVGTTGIVAHVGLRHPFYSYKLSTIVQASNNLGIYSLQRVLHMVNDYTNTTEIGSLFLAPDYRRDGIGGFLSRCRFLMLAQFPEVFADRVIAEIRGAQDAQGESAFYKNLAGHFFQMPFQKADFIHATQGGQFISDLMPKYPIYVELLAKEAQEVIGKPLEASKPAMHLLEKEGFIYQGYIDLFDAGPTMQIQRNNIETVKKSVLARVVDIEKSLDAPLMMVGNTNLQEFMMARAPVQLNGEEAKITAEVAKHLKLERGDKVRVAV
jgi:arginine N-succinyltransferase